MSYGSSPSDPHEIFQYSYMPPQNYGYLADGGTVNGTNDEPTFWPNSPRTDSPSPTNGQGPLVGPYQIYTPVSYPSTDHHHHRPGQYSAGTKSGYNLTHPFIVQNCCAQYDYTANRNPPMHVPFVRVVKRRNTANKKERRRTQSINNAYSDLRDCIPNVPADTKLSKIKTLRLATSYISYLTEVLETNEPAVGFKAELVATSRKSSGAHHNSHQVHHHQQQLDGVDQTTPKCDQLLEDAHTRRSKGRTGWPQHVWALELKQEPAL